MKVIACNWKMNMNLEQINEFFSILSNSNLSNSLLDNEKELIIFPSFLHIKHCIDTINNLDINNINIGSQDVSQFENGAFTGSVSAAMLSDIGIKNCLVGHSERRLIFKDHHTIISDKIKQLLKYKMKITFCIGETLSELESNQFESVIQSQLSVFDEINIHDSNIIIGYEPVWSIGTGKIPTLEEIQKKHYFIKNFIQKKHNSDCKILYGGSVNENNFADILSIKNVDGLLIGGASLKVQNVIKFLK